MGTFPKKEICFECFFASTVASFLGPSFSFPSLHHHQMPIVDSDDEISVLDNGPKYADNDVNGMIWAVAAELPDGVWSFSLA